MKLLSGPVPAEKEGGKREEGRGGLVHLGLLCCFSAAAAGWSSHVGGAFSVQSNY